MTQLGETLHLEKRALVWDRGLTIAILILLLAPLPFARFETWPERAVLSERLIMPWSRFRFCYLSYPGAEPVVDSYAFTWTGRLIPPEGSSSSILIFSSMEPPLLQWQDNPEMPMKDLFVKGDFLHVRTSWRPVLLWPFLMLWRTVDMRSK